MQGIEGKNYLNPSRKTDLTTTDESNLTPAKWDMQNLSIT